MNKYASNIRTYCARNVLEAVINPPADLSILMTDWKPQFFRSHFPGIPAPWGINGNFILRQVGMFCQFGEGLILASPSNRMDIYFSAYGYAPDVGDPISSITFTEDSKAITGANFNADLGPGAVVLDSVGNAYFVDTVTDDANAVLCDYARDTCVLSPIQLLVTTTLFDYIIPDWSLFNVMTDQEIFMPVASLVTPTPAGTPDRILFSVRPVNASPDVTHPTFLTKSIETAFAGDTAIFDMYAQIEFTPI